MKRKNVLITNATGVLERQLVEGLLHDRNVGRIIGVASEELPYYFQDLDPTRFFYRRMDILKSRQLKNFFLSTLFKESRVNVVVHGASMRNSVNFEQGRLSEGTKRLMSSCIEAGYITKFVFLSSYHVYRLRAHTAIQIKEDADLNFDKDATPMIRELIDTDMLCRTKMDTPGMRIIVLRPSPTVGRNVCGPFNALLETMFPTIPLGYNPIINPIHDQDVVRAMKLAVHCSVKGVFNVAGKEFAPVAELLSRAGHVPVSLPEFMLKRVYKSQRKVCLTKVCYRDIRDLLRYGCVLDCEQAQNKLGYRPEYHIKFV